MNPLKPQPSFIWPESRVFQKICTYDHQPPLEELVQKSKSFFGFITALTSRGVGVIEDWLEQNPELMARLVVIVYPTCATRQTDLSCILHLAQRHASHLIVNVHPLERLTDRATNALCFLTSSDEAYLFTGPSEDLGLGTPKEACINFVFRAEPVLVECFKRYFDYMWALSQKITAQGVAQIPDLVIPDGTEEAARLWKEYRSCFLNPTSPDTVQVIPKVNPETGDVTIQTPEGKDVPVPTEELGLEKLDHLAERTARLYEKGALVSIDKLSRIPPLDAPLSPKFFGDVSEMQRGNVSRKVSMRVSIIDEAMLKEIEKRRKGLRTLLIKFTFGLADNMRWMPRTAQKQFEYELNRINDEGLELISNLLKGDVEEFIEEKRDILIADIKNMYKELGSQGRFDENVVEQVTNSLKERLIKAKSTSFMPQLSYSTVSFVRTSNTMASPWGQAFSLLVDIAKFPRKALTDSFFFRGLKIDEEALIESMNVTDDTLCLDLQARRIKVRCEDELELLKKIQNAVIESRDRCELVWQIIDGISIDSVEESLEQKKNERK